MTEHVIAHQIDAVLELRLARPEKKNALHNAMYGALADALAKAQGDGSVRCVLLSAEGGDFTAGNDLADFAAIGTGALAPEARHVGRFLKQLALAQKPLIAAVQGQAVGIGCTMLLHCDLVYVAPDARLTTPFCNLGLVPEAASSLLLPARIGHARAYAMFALGEAISGQEAVSIGLANAAFPADQLREAALQRARQLASRAPGALSATKALLRDAGQIAAQMEREGKVFEQRLVSAEAREAFSAFLQKRAPVFH